MADLVVHLLCGPKTRPPRRLRASRREAKERLLLDLDAMESDFGSFLTRIWQYPPAHLLAEELFRLYEGIRALRVAVAEDHPRVAALLKEYERREKRGESSNL